MWPNDSDPELIYLTDGASKGVMQILNCVIRGEGDGVILCPKTSALILLLKTSFISCILYRFADSSSGSTVSTLLSYHITLRWFSCSLLSR